MEWIIFSIILAIFFGIFTVLNYLGIKLPVVQTRPWGGMNKFVENLASKISQGFDPDVVIGIEGGGIIIGGLLITNYNSYVGGDIPFYIQRQHYVPKEGGKLGKVIPDDIPNECIENKKVLLVDSLVYTGDTMKEVKTLLESKDPIEIKTAVIFKLKGTAHPTDFYVKEVTSRELMPWAFTEEYKARYGKWD